MANGTSVESRKCSLSTLKGNPYLYDGCEESEECARCSSNYNSYCNYDIIYDGDGSSRSSNFRCISYNLDHISFGSKSSMGVILGVSISVGVLLLVATTFALYKILGLGGQVTQNIAVKKEVTLSVSNCIWVMVLPNSHRNVHWICDM
ncbi:hypothetical protein L1987_37261 [Smallanthus sonchifolius]|uniref:Uncharacterized protein n=1 Tax=Smallanthus sonchifolius TaxID=185202 RepID=A0ACB9HH50_9ASTR|nr:hypothetical protein L1987_37261 [Smallanthus sonchifolius]